MGSDSMSKRANRSVEHDNEPVPEWFQAPASIHDVIDLRGFDDDVESRDQSASSVDKMGKKEGLGGLPNRHQRTQQRDHGRNGMHANYQRQQQPQMQHPVYQSSK